MGSSVDGGHEFVLLILQQIGDAELEQELGITNTLHRLKLRLAVQEIVTFTTNTKSQHRTVRRQAEIYYLVRTAVSMERNWGMKGGPMKGTVDVLTTALSSRPLPMVKWHTTGLETIGCQV